MRNNNKDNPHVLRERRKMKIIETNNAPAAVGPYSQATVIGSLVFSSGQIPINPISGEIEGTDISSQAEQAIKNLAGVLKAADSSLENVIKTTCYLKDMNDFAKFNEIYACFFTEKPARSCVEVSALPKGALLEIDAVAFTYKG